MKRTLVALLAATALTACDDAIGPDSLLAPEEVAQLSDALIQEGFTETTDTAAASLSTATDGLALDSHGVTEFTWTRSCPLGGDVTMTGTREWTRDMETRTGTMDLTATRSFEDCARPLADETVITLNGDVTFSAHREWQAGQWSGMQEITIVGVIDWATDDGRSDTCEIDIVASFDPETHTRTVTGTVCDYDISEIRGWSWTLGHGPGHAGQGPHGDGMADPSH